MENIIPLIPDDLLVRMIKRLREEDRGQIVRALEATQIAAGLVVNLGELRRAVCVVRLSDEELEEEDRRWKMEREKARKALLGVYSGRVRPEAVLVELLYFEGSEDYRKLYEESAGKLGWGAEFMAVTRAIFSRAGAGR